MFLHMTAINSLTVACYRSCHRSNLRAAQASQKSHLPTLMTEIPAAPPVLKLKRTLPTAAFSRFAQLSFLQGHTYFFHYVGGVSRTNWTFRLALQEVRGKPGNPTFQEPETFTVRHQLARAQIPATYYCHQTTADTLH